ncbi:MAG: substrate-binding domain-containing protein [Clostridia bacterium]|nr:substrate-binding domain-containing protein [Clostridia bacterium]
MGKKSRVLITILVMIIVIGGCIFAYMKLGKKDNQVSEEPISTEPIFTLENYPKVDASLATQPLTSAMIKNFTGEDVKDEDLNYSNTHPAYVKLINDEVDLIVVTEPSEGELALAKEKGVELEVIPVVREGFVFYVNGNNKVESLTLEQIQKIYTGEITNWSEVGGDDEKIIPYQRPTNSGSQTGLLSLVMKDLEVMDSVKNVISTMEGIIKVVADYNNGKGAMGYSYFYYATAMYNLIDENSENGIRLLGVNGVKPTYESIKDGSYPIQTAYYIVINKNEPEDSDTRKLVDAMLSARGQNVAKEAGYVPVK